MDKQKEAYCSCIGVYVLCVLNLRTKIENIMDGVQCKIID